MSLMSDYYLEQQQKNQPEDYFAPCNHDNTIDVGDDDHVLMVCTDCGKSDRDEYQAELNAQHRAVELDHEAIRLNQKNTYSDALSESYNDDPKYTSKYE